MGLEEEEEEGEGFLVEEVEEVFLFGAAAVRRLVAEATIGDDDDDDDDGRAGAGLLLLLPTSHRCVDGVDASVCLIANGGKESWLKRESARASERRRSRAPLLKSERVWRCFIRLVHFFSLGDSFSPPEIVD